MTPKPLITHVIPTIGRGGAERLAIELAARLPAHGFRTRLVSLFDSGPLWQDIRERDIRYTQILPEHRATRIELLRGISTTLFGDIERRPALVHTHLFGADFWVNLVWSLQRIVNQDTDLPPVISTAHNIDHDDGSLRRAARVWTNRRMHRIVAISQDVKRYLHEDLHIPQKQIDLISNGIVLDDLMIRREGGFHEIPRLIIVGRLERQKGHEILFKALAQVPPPWRLDVVGTGSLFRELKELVESLGIASRVYFLGDRSDVPKLLEEADLFVFPSQWEGMGLAVLEAMASGLPVLASSLPALRDFIPKQRLVVPDDAEQWAIAIKESLANENTIFDEALDLKNHIRDCYGIERMVEAYAKLYRLILKRV